MRSPVARDLKLSGTSKGKTVPIVNIHRDNVRISLFNIKSILTGFSVFFYTILPERKVLFLLVFVI